MNNPSPNQVKMSVGANPKHKFSMSAPTVTTSALMEAFPIHCVELIPDTKGEGHVSNYHQFDPVQLPVVGQASNKVRAFFVPLRTVWKPYPEFMTDTPVVNASTGSSIPLEVPSFDWNAFLDFFLNNTRYASTSTSNYDIKFGLVSYILTPLGRYIMKVLVNLGYSVQAGDDKTSFFVSFLPILSWSKIYFDWYYPSQYAKLTPEFQLADTMFNATDTYVAQPRDVADLLASTVGIAYDDSYFVSAWDNPVSPSAGAFSGVTLIDVSQGDSGLGMQVMVSSSGGSPATPTPAAGSPYMLTEKYTPTPNVQTAEFTQYQISMLEALTAYMRRHQISGSRALDRWLADYGLTLRVAKMNRSVYLGLESAPIQFGRVTSTSDTNGAVLGQFAGQAQGYIKDFKFDIDTKDDFGFLIPVASIIPDAPCVQGNDRLVHHISKFDFYTPPFDGKGTQAIGADELYTSSGNSSFNDGIAQRVFGFSQRYAEYKMLRARLSGDFVLNSKNVGIDGYHLFRMFDDNSFNGDPSNIVHDIDFVLNNDRDQFYRIFNITNPSLGDPIKSVYWLSLDISAPMLPLYDDYVFHNDDEHAKIQVDVNGVKMN